MTFKILLVDDHPMVRLATRSLIQQSGQEAEIAEAGNAEDALAMIAADNFDLVFLDAKLPSKKGEEALVETGKKTLVKIREDDGPRVVVMSAESSNRELVTEMMTHGASTWVPKTAEIAYTMEAIRRALGGGVWLPPELLGKGGNSPPPAPQSLLGPLPEPVTAKSLGLSDSQFGVLRLALSGLNAKKIADTLDINYDNVKKKLCKLYAKFGTSDQVSLHAYFAKTGQTLGIISQPLPKPKRDAAALPPGAPTGSPAE